MIQVQHVCPSKLSINPHNVRTHSDKQIRQIIDSITAFGFVVAILVDENYQVIAGHARLDAAKRLKLGTVPVIVLEGLSPAKRRALMLADNRIAQNAGWDRKRLAIELPELTERLICEGLDISITGFEPVEIDQIALDFEEDTTDPADDVNAFRSNRIVTRRGDLWELGEHRILCADARSESDLDTLMRGELASMAFLDPPYNTQIRKAVGRGRRTHADFAMASGEMSAAEFVDFLIKSLGNAAARSLDGGLHYVCMDWRHIHNLIEAGRQAYGDLLNIAVWVKPNAGQGSFYRSQHEMVAIFRVGSRPHLNNIELGRHGRSRSNVWHYAGVNSFRAGRLDDLAAHPTVKPIAMVADALKDCTRRGDVVLDTFGGSGTTLLAAERVGRKALLMEIEPKYVDVAIRRWLSFTRKDAVHMGSRVTFYERERQLGSERLAREP